MGLKIKIFLVLLIFSLIPVSNTFCAWQGPVVITTANWGSNDSELGI